MTESQIFSNILPIIAALVGGLGGYIIRKAQKFEDHFDKIYAEIIPTIIYDISTFTLAVQIYKKNQDFIDFRTRLEGIISDLRKQIQSGAITIAKLDSDKYKLTEFYWNLEEFFTNIRDIEKDESRQNDLFSSFEDGNKDLDWLHINPLEIYEKSKDLKEKIELNFKKKKNNYIIIIFLIAIVLIPVIQLISTNIIPESNDTTKFIGNVSISLK